MPESAGMGWCMVGSPVGLRIEYDLQPTRPGENLHARLPKTHRLIHGSYRKE